MSFGLSGGFANVVVVLFKFKNNWLDLEYFLFISLWCFQFVWFLLRCGCAFF